MTKRPVPNITPREQALKDIDKRIDHLSALGKAKLTELDALVAERQGSWNGEVQTRCDGLDKERVALEQEVIALRRQRFDIERSVDPEYTGPKQAQPIRKAARAWQITKTSVPTFPAPGSDDETVAKAFDGYLESHVAVAQTAFQKAGAGPDSHVTASALAVMYGNIMGFMSWTSEKIKAQAKRIEELEAAPIRYRGVWQKSDTYKRGNVVTDASSAWHAIKDVEPGDRPGASDSWQLMVKGSR